MQKLSWLTPLGVALWYTLYGWGLCAKIASPMDWGFALLASIILAMAIEVAFLLAVPATLAAAWILAVPVVLDAAVFRGNAPIVGLVNTYFSNPARSWPVFLALAILLAVCWFSPLFFSKRQLKRSGLSRNQIFWVLSAASWIGLGLGWLLGQWYFRSPPTPWFS